MNVLHMKTRILILAFTFLFLIAPLTPVSARLFFFKSDKNIPPDKYLQRENQVNSYNEQAIELFEQGRFEEAQKLWEQAIQLMENFKGHVGSYSMRQAISSFTDEDLIFLGDDQGLRESDVEDLYETAVSLFKKQKYVASKKMFDRVEVIIPDYKASRNYLTILKHKIKRAQQTLVGDKFKQNALARREERVEWKRILNESERELKQRLAEQVDPLYQEALHYYKSREFTLAKDYFTEINNIFPEYKNTTEYLARIDLDILEEKQRLVNDKHKKEILARKKEKEEWERIHQVSEERLQKKIKDQAETVYQEALFYYKHRQFDLAKDRFQEVELVFPDYKSTSKYLKRIDKDLWDDFRFREQQRAQKLAQHERRAELAKKREEKRLQELRTIKEEEHLRQFREEIAERRKEREEWLKVLEENEKKHPDKSTRPADANAFHIAFQSAQ